MIDTALLFDDLCQGPLRALDAYERSLFQARMETCWEDIERPLTKLYGHRDDFPQWVSTMLHLVAKAYAERPADLKQLDLVRSIQPDWFQRSNMMGYVCYTNRFADSLKDVATKIDYLKELDITYLHLMPLLEPRDGPNDGGYAVADYRSVNPKLGTMDDLASLATTLRQNGISLCIDLVCNHTAKEHEWAQKAMAGDPFYQNYYLMFPDRDLPDQYEQTLPEVFPDFAPGNFTYYPAIEKWVWTTFNEYQWDLNYTNPAVLAEMLGIMLFLANQGVEILRLDAVAFMWKRMGTDSQNQPEAHSILQAFRALSRIAAPGLLLKAEAIVSPRDLITYLGRGIATNRECEIAYHNVFMVMLWSSLAEKSAVLMTSTLQRMPAIPSAAAWATYIRCHDDIGWAVTDEDAGAVGLNAFAHRSFLSDFYNGTYAGTFSRGTTFQFNPKTNDRRINGSLASLAGLEVALEWGDVHLIDLAIDRILLLHSLIFAFGGIPLIYMGDEIGLLNDESYLEDPDLADDSRWIHRPRMDWQLAEERSDESTVTGRIYQGIRRLIAARQRAFPLHAAADRHPVWLHNDRVFGLLRESPRGRVLVLANVTDGVQSVPRYRLQELGFGSAVDWVTMKPIEAQGDLLLRPYQVFWLANEESA